MDVMIRNNNFIFIRSNGCSIIRNDKEMMCNNRNVMIRNHEQRNKLLIIRNKYKIGDNR